MKPLIIILVHFYSVHIHYVENGTEKKTKFAKFPMKLPPNKKPSSLAFMIAPIVPNVTHCFKGGQSLLDFAVLSQHSAGQK